MDLCIYGKTRLLENSGTISKKARIKSLRGQPAGAALKEPPAVAFVWNAPIPECGLGVISKLYNLHIESPFLPVH